MSEIKANSKAALDLLEEQVRSMVEPMGYDVVALEQTSGPARSGRTLVLYIDFPQDSEDREAQHISLDDCTKVNTAIDELFESTQLIDGAFTLEVSSPGVERPLRRPMDYDRFRGKKARLHTFRPLEVREIENENYWTKNQKQKNFVGILKGLSSGHDKVQMEIDGNLVAVPLQLVSKAHLEYVAPESFRKG